MNIKKNYLKAKAEYEKVLKLIKECQEKVLNENEFYTTEGEEVNLLNDYLMTDEDAIDFWKLCSIEYKKIGLKQKHYEDSIDYPYMAKLRKAENDLIAWGKSKIEKLAAYKMNVEDIAYLYKMLSYNLKVREKVINLTMSIS